ncbi:hypothetical protein CANARDRAFT_188170, partial [[Candida] arabinofermentans NRRL YB-2248]
LPPTFGSVKPTLQDNQMEDISEDQSVPTELTLNGTTPSGKPRLYVCNVCTRAFARQEHLKRHERSHTKEKPFACNICSRKFSRRDLLLRHSTKLHAGASEVIPRLRKRSIKASSSPPSSHKSTDNSEASSPSSSMLANAANTTNKTRKSRRMSIASTAAVSKPLASISKKPYVSATVEQRLKEDSENIKEEDLSKTLRNLDFNLEFPIGNRRASFSAMSGNNYAMPTVEPYATETVEFSTPQLFAFDDESEHWLNSLPNLELLEPDFSAAGAAAATASATEKRDLHDLSVAPDDPALKHGENITGYSFYDVPSRNVGSLFAQDRQIGRSSSDRMDYQISDRQNYQAFKPHSPILQESPDTDSSIPTQSSDEKIKNWQETLFNQNINDLEAMADLNVSRTYDIPQGYSFYGNSDQNTVPNSSSCSSNATISPILLDNTLSVNSRQNSPGHFVPSHTDHRDDHPGRRDSVKENEFLYSKDRFEKYSRVNLFTSTIRSYIYQSLSKYPFLGVPSPTIPDNEKLNFYTDEFKNKFLNHHPFIHRSMLNEYSLMKVTLNSLEQNLIRDENSIDNTRVSLVCLPLLIATVGAIVSNKKNDAANLYEASRRCIHVYLDSRKKLVRAPGLAPDGSENVDGTSSSSKLRSNNSSPLWLVQSLTLSVVYGLFADDEISLNVIIRQVNALNSLIKSSGLNSITFQDYSTGNNKSEIDEAHLETFIRYESTIRTVHMVFHISSLLSALYNIVPSLKVDDLMIDLPTSTLLWDCSSLIEFKNLVNSFDFKAENYQKVLNELITLPFQDLDSETGLINGTNFLFDNHVSEFGLICLQNGLHQLAYFKQLTSTSVGGSSTSTELPSGIKTDDQLLQVSRHWDNMLRACKLYNETSEVFIDCKILNHYLSLKFSKIMSLNKIKENVWLRSFNDINELYYNNYDYNDLQLKDKQFQTELISLIDNCIQILKLVFFQPSDETGDSGVTSNDGTGDNLNSGPTNDQLDEFYDPDLGRVDMKFLNKLSIDSQLLFDVVAIVVKFLMNFESSFKMKMKYNNLSSVSFLQHFELRSMIFNNGINKQAESEFDEVLFKYYMKFFKIYLNLEYFLKMHYDYHDFETEFSSLTISNIINKDRHHYRQQEKNLNSILKDDLVVLRDKDLIINELIQFKLPFKFLKIGSFLFSFIYDKSFKFVNFKNLSDVLFHLRVFLENRDEYV